MSKADLDFPCVRVGGFATISCTRKQLAQVMVKDCLRARSSGNELLPKLVFSSNGQGIALAGRSAEFMKVMSQADIVHADGMPAVFASKMTVAPLPERIPTTDFFHDAARVAAIEGLKFFMLGASDRQNRKAVDDLSRRYPNLQIVGRHHGYFSDAQDEEVCEHIRISGADVVWVALGKPRQEEWCLRNRHRLKGVGWLKTCGGLYAFLAGDVRRAPAWMQSIGLEWLFRMIEDPKRLAWRYLWTNPYALYRLARFTTKGSAVV